MKPAQLTYGSVCSGMEAASLAWAPLGWRCAFVSEIDKAPNALLKERYPDVPNFGDMTKFEEWPDVAIDVLVGGTPCQSFSIAGLRKGLADPRGSLMLTYGAIAQRYRPTWLVWENVPGVLSDDEGRSFGTFLGMLAELGYGFAYRVLDAQFFGVAQRRARVFVVGHLGDWRSSAAVLFEPESLRGDSPPRRQAGEGVAATVTSSLGGVSHKDDAAGRVVALDYTNGTIGGDLCGTLEAAQSKGNRGHGVFAFKASHFTRDKDGAPSEISPALSADADKGDQDTLVMAFDTTQITSPECRSQPAPGQPCHTLAKAQHPPAIAFQTSGNCGAWETGDVTGALDTMTDPNSHVLAFSSKDHGADAGELAPTLRAMGHAESHANAGGQVAVAMGYAVRRLTPRECERLQGAPDDHTLISYRGKPMADGPRYKMIGNSMAVPCMRWLGERIALVHGIKAASDGEPKCTA